MKIELLEKATHTFKQVKVNETFLVGKEPFLRVKHTETCLMELAKKRSVTVAGSGFAVNLSTGNIVLVSDSVEVVKSDFWLKEIK